MKVLVTGSTGRIGNHLLPALNEAGYGVETTYVTHDGAWPDPTLGGYTPETIIHLAGQTRVSASISSPIEDAMTNVITTIRVLEYARAHEAKVIIPASAGTMYDLQSPYSLSKRAAADYGMLYNQLHGLDVVVLGLGNVYGPGMGGVIHQMIMDERESRPGTENPKGITLNGGGIEVRDYIYIDDVVRAFVEAIEWRPAYYEIATARPSSVWDVFRLLTFEWGYTPKKVEGELPKGVVLSRHSLRCDLPWVPIPLEEGLPKTLRSYG